jgi:hypothetical protein
MSMTWRAVSGRHYSAASLGGGSTGAVPRFAYPLGEYVALAADGTWHGGYSRHALDRRYINDQPISGLSQE